MNFVADESLEVEIIAALRESGVLDRTYVDTIENIVGIIEALAARVYRSGQ